MEEMQSMLKEVDIQIVRERLKARKKNLTGPDGTTKAPKQMLADVYRGWYGYETRYSALLRMSNEAVAKTNHHNERLRLKHMVDMDQLVRDEKSADGKATRDIQAMREDFRSMLAYKYVYKKHGFRRYDSSREINKLTNRPMSDKTALSEGDIPRPISQQRQRPLGSLRESSTYELEFHFPSLDTPRDTTEKRDHPPPDRSQSRISFGTETGTMASFPKIDKALGVEIRYLKHDEDEDESVYSIHRDGTIYSTLKDSRPSTRGLDMGQNLIRMRQLEQKKYERENLTTPATDTQNKRRMLPKTPNKIPAGKRMLPKTPSDRPASTLPNEMKSEIAMKKFYEREASEFLSTWSSTTKRKEEVEKMKSREEPKYDIIERTRSTSAILREFKRIKEEEEIRRQEQQDQPMVVRQMSPVQRVESAKSRRIAAYNSRNPTQQQKEKIKNKAKGQTIGRTKSFIDDNADDSFDDEIEVLETFPKSELEEKFPSVSRTTSYQTLPDDTLAMHENAFLTAAERIEKEKEFRKIQLELGQKQTSHSNRVPHIKVVNQYADEDGKTTTTNTTKLKPTLVKKSTHSGGDNESKIWDSATVSTAITNSKLRQNTVTDIALINKVKEVNTSSLMAGTWDPRVSRKPPIPYGTPKQSWKRKKNGTKQLPQPLVDPSSLVEYLKQKRQDIHHSEDPHQSRLTMYAGMTSHQKRKHDYDNFSRVSPDTKQKLEMRAKKKRQKQLERAKQIEEKYPRKTKGSDVDRPPTRVSFNDQVVVYQTQ